MPTEGAVRFGMWQLLAGRELLSLALAQLAQLAQILWLVWLAQLAQLGSQQSLAPPRSSPGWWFSPPEPALGSPKTCCTSVRFPSSFGNCTASKGKGGAKVWEDVLRGEIATKGTLKPHL